MAVITTITSTIIDEEIRTPATNLPSQTQADENEVDPATFNASAFKASIPAGIIPVGSFPSGFPQFAEKVGFVSFTGSVTDFFLTGSSTGTPLPATGTATLLKVGDTTVFLFPTSNPDVVVGRVGTEGGATDTADPSGAVAFIVGIEETKTNGLVDSADMWIALFAPLTHNGANLVDSADKLDLSSLLYLGASFNTTSQFPFNNFEGVPSGNNLFNVIFPNVPVAEQGAVQLLLTGSKPDPDNPGQDELSTVNVSSTGIGAGSQHIDVGATLRIDTVQGMVKSSVDQANEVNQATNIAYSDTGDPGNDARVEIIKADFEVQQVNPGNPNDRVDIKIAAYNVAGQDQGQTYLNNINVNGQSVAITGVKIINDANQDITVAWKAAGGTITFNQDGTVTITGLNDGLSSDKTDGDRVEFTTSGVPFDRFTIKNVDGDANNTLDVGNIHVTVVQGSTGTEYAEVGSSLIFEDDGPKITGDASSLSALIADETTLGTDPSGSFASAFTVDAGADAPADSVTYALGVTLSGGNAPDSGLVDTLTGDHIFLFLEGTLVKGRSGDSATLAASGPVVFEISVNSSGLVTLDQKSAVFHTDSNDFDSTSPAMTASLITLTASTADGEPNATDDPASASINIGNLFKFKDDGPTLTVQDPNGPAPNDLKVDNDLSDAGDSTDSSTYAAPPLLAGADGKQSYTIVNPTDGSHTADSLGTYRWTYDSTTGANAFTSITGTVRVNNVDQPLYTLVLDQNGGYTFTMTGTLPSSKLPLDVDDIKAGGPNSNSIIVGTLNDPLDRSVEIAATGGPINESNDNVGVTNGNLDSGEALTFELLDANGDPISFQGLSIGTKTASGGTYSWTATTADGNPPTKSGFETVVKNEAIVIDPADLGGELITSITIMKTSGSTTKIGLDKIEIFLPAEDVQLDFKVELKDGDNDTATQSFVVDIDGNNDGTYSASVSSLSVPVDSSTFSTIESLHHQEFADPHDAFAF